MIAPVEFAAELRPGRYRVLFTFDVAGQPLTLTEELTIP